MKIASLTGHVTELYSIVSSWEKPADKIINDFYRARKYLGSKDRKFISDITYSLIRNTRLLEQIKQNIFPVLDGLHPFEILIYIEQVITGNPNGELIGYFKEKIPGYDETTSMIRKEYEILSPDPYLKYSFPEWMRGKFSGLTDIIDMEKFLGSLNEPAKISIRLTHSNESELVNNFKEQGVSVIKSKIAPAAYQVSKRINFPEMESFKKGDFEVQDEGSQLVTLFSGAAGEMKVLDACAGGGGKSLYLSSLINENGKIFSYDNDTRRIEQFRKRLKGKNYENIVIIDNENKLNELTGKCDLVVIDAPCSGSGTIKRNPDLKWRLRESDIPLYAEKQIRILTEYSKYLKTGGNIAYITCSFFKEENEEVISLFLSAFKKYSMSTNSDFFAKYPLSASNGFLRLYPHIHDTDGFTACLIKKDF